MTVDLSLNSTNLIFLKLDSSAVYENLNLHRKLARAFVVSSSFPEISHRILILLKLVGYQLLILKRYQSLSAKVTLDSFQSQNVKLIQQTLK